MGLRQADLRPVRQDDGQVLTGKVISYTQQLNVLDDAHPNQPAVVVEKGVSLLGEMPQVAPVEIRDAVTAVVNDYRAEAGVPGATAPDNGALQRAEASVEAFEDQNC